MGDFDIAPGPGSTVTVTLDGGTTSGTVVNFTLTIFDDEILEDDEEFTVSIVDNPEFTTGAPSSVVVTIRDDDGEPFSTRAVL